MIEIVVPNKRYNRNVPNLGEDLTKQEIIDICFAITGKKDFRLILDNERSTGRYVTIKNGSTVHFVGISNREVGGRNSFVQTIATIFSAYVNASYEDKRLDYYFLPIKGNNLTSYLKFCYRLMKTIRFNFINPQEGFGSIVLKPYEKVTDIINDRNDISIKNSSNNSSYITDDGYEYKIYGKSFGANSKETALICFAISFITDKPVKLFQILDNNSDSISRADKQAIRELNKINIIDDTFIFDTNKEIPDDTDVENIRSARFIYNLFSKYGKKKCALCGCQISNLISGAHIWPVSDIKKTEIPLEQKKAFASDADNGIWLCENHHKLFDSNLLEINSQGHTILSEKLTFEEKQFVNTITTEQNVKLNDKMLEYLKLRYKN